MNLIKNLSINIYKYSCNDKIKLNHLIKSKLEIKRIVRKSPYYKKDEVVKYNLSKNTIYETKTSDYDKEMKELKKMLGKMKYK